MIKKYGPISAPIRAERTNCAVEGGYIMREKRISKFKHLPKFVIVSALVLLLTIGILPLGFRAEAAAHSHRVCEGTSCKDTSHSAITWTVYKKSFKYTNHVACIYLSKDTSATLTVDSGNTLYLCLNGKTLTGRIVVNGTLHLCDCVGTGIVNGGNKGTASAITGESSSTIYYYNGTLKGGKGANDEFVPLYTDGIIKLYDVPKFETPCDYDIRGLSANFIQICRTLDQPAKPARVNFGTGVSSVDMTKQTQVTLTSGWYVNMGNVPKPTDYFSPRNNRYAKIELSGGNVVLRRNRVTFVDGNSKSTDYAKYKGGTLAFLPTPSRTGYTFKGWFTAQSGGTKITTSTVFEDDTTVYAQWTANTYTVRFDINYTGGTNPTSQTVTYGSTYGTLPKPTRSGYTFMGWYTALNGGTLIRNGTMVSTASNHTLYAHWKVIEIISVEITWGTMEFTYCDGDWDPDTHTYINGYWAPNATGSDLVTVVNTGNVAVSVTFGYEKTNTAVSAAFSIDGNGTNITTPVALLVNDTKKVRLTLTGKPSGTMSKATLGTVKITLR